MKKRPFRIREEIARLQEQLKNAETREAERVGRIALRAGLGEIEIDEADLQVAFEELAKRFRGGRPSTSGRKGAGESSSAAGQPEALASGASAGSPSEA